MIQTAELLSMSGLSKNSMYAFPMKENELMPRLLKGETRLAVQAKAQQLLKLELTAVDIAKIILLAQGALTPLDGFMVESEYKSVLSEMRLNNGAIWSLPLTLAVDEQTAVSIKPDQKVALCENGRVTAVLEVKDIYSAPTQNTLLNPQAHQKSMFLGGEVWVIDLPKTASPTYNIQFTPAQTRRMFSRRGWQKIAGYHPTNPIFRTHEYIQKSALELVDGLFILHNITQFDTLHYPQETSVASYQTVLKKYYPSQNFLFAVYPGFEPINGPRQMLTSALIHKNYGCTHFILDANEQQNVRCVFDTFSANELGIEIMLFNNTYFCTQCDMIVSQKTCPHGKKYAIDYNIQQIQTMLKKEQTPPQNFIRAEVSNLFAKKA